MKLFLLSLISGLLIISCAEEPKNPFNIIEEPLSSKAEVKASSWIGYKDFSYELKNLTENFTMDYAIEKTRALVSTSQALLYSIPADLRNEITNEKATELVQSTKDLNNAMTTKSEGEIIAGLNNIVDAYTALNKEINYYTDNQE
jgi:hypothetical protein